MSTELLITQHFIIYTLNNIEDGYVKRKEMERFIPRKKEDVLLLADSLITKKHKDYKYYEDINNAYKLLKVELEKYAPIAKQGGWPRVSIKARQIKKGTVSPEIVILKKRLSLTGDMAADTTPVFNEGLEDRIKSFQARFGYKANGMLMDGLLNDMNVPVITRIKQILINMGRMQWMIHEPLGQMMVVNIPEFILHVKRRSHQSF
jgi:L,D-transpeptidase YcbB